MHEFFTAAKYFLSELKDIIILATFVLITGISAYQFIKWKLTH
jgi:hypothetical protein